MAKSPESKKRGYPAVIGLSFVDGLGAGKLKPDHYTGDCNGPGKIERVECGHNAVGAPRSNFRHVARSHADVKADQGGTPQSGLSVRLPMGGMSGTFGDHIDEEEQQWQL